MPRFLVQIRLEVLGARSGCWPLLLRIRRQTWLRVTTSHADLLTVTWRGVISRSTVINWVKYDARQGDCVGVWGKKGANHIFWDIYGQKKPDLATAISLRKSTAVERAERVSRGCAGMRKIRDTLKIWSCEKVWRKKIHFRACMRDKF